MWSKYQLLTCLTLGALVLSTNQACENPGALDLSKGPSLKLFGLKTPGDQDDGDDGNGGGYGGIQKEMVEAYHPSNWVNRSSKDFGKSFFRFGSVESPCNYGERFPEIGHLIRNIITHTAENNKPKTMLHESVCDEQGREVLPTRRASYNSYIAVHDGKIYYYHRKVPATPAQAVKLVAYCSLKGFKLPNDPALPKNTKKKDYTQHVGIDFHVRQSMVAPGDLTSRLVLGRYDGKNFLKVSSKTETTYSKVATVSGVPSIKFYKSGVYTVTIPSSGPYPRKGRIQAVYDDQKIDVLADCWIDK